jgi:hypothetical protein
VAYSKKVPAAFLIALALAPKSPFDGVAAKNVAAFREAVLRKDFGWFERTYAPDFRQLADGQAIPRTAALAQLRHGLLGMTVRSLKGQVLSVRPKGAGYVATVEFTGTMRAGISGQPATLTAKWKDDQTWAPAKGRWVLKSLSTREFTREITPN